MTTLPPDLKLPRREAERLAALVAGVDAVDIEEAQSAISEHLRKLIVASRSNEFLDVPLARGVVATIQQLLLSARSFSDDDQRLIIAASRYFALKTDADDDYGSPIGLEDDARVVNAVAAAVGRADLTIVIPA